MLCRAGALRRSNECGVYVRAHVKHAARIVLECANCVMTRTLVFFFCLFPPCDGMRGRTVSAVNNVSSTFVAWIYTRVIIIVQSGRNKWPVTQRGCAEFTTRQTRTKQNKEKGVRNNNDGKKRSEYQQPTAPKAVHHQRYGYSVKIICDVHILLTQRKRAMLCCDRQNEHLYLLPYL